MVAAAAHEAGASQIQVLIVDNDAPHAGVEVVAVDDREAVGVFCEDAQRIQPRAQAPGATGTFSDPFLSVIVCARRSTSSIVVVPSATI